MEVGEELTVSSSQLKECDLSCSVQLLALVSSKFRAVKQVNILF